MRWFIIIDAADAIFVSKSFSLDIIDFDKKKLRSDFVIEAFSNTSFRLAADERTYVDEFAYDFYYQPFSFWIPANRYFDKQRRPR